MTSYSIEGLGELVARSKELSPLLWIRRGFVQDKCQKRFETRLSSLEVLIAQKDEVRNAMMRPSHRVRLWPRKLHSSRHCLLRRDSFGQVQPRHSMSRYHFWLSLSLHLSLLFWYQSVQVCSSLSPLTTVKRGEQKIFPKMICPWLYDNISYPEKPMTNSENKLLLET
ncbi:hypothetical protein AMTR_s00130p00042410 [Amborella trichopoda]|uniref:Uncharacterized protein n=1 Tax=Amborella trichopoda TaxID=13333 RepID=W1NNV4_AMBTC|nr:hypothetical protein AMTR_s00130p00042410 [Amborella trichopoda]